MASSSTGKSVGLAALIVVAALAAQRATNGGEKPSPPALRILKGLFGKGEKSEEMTNVRRYLKREPEVARFEGLYYLVWKEEGIDIQFEPKGATVIFFYAEGADSHKQYQGELPEGLTFSDTRQDVEKKLGKAPTSGGNDVVPFWVHYPEKGLGITFVSKDTKDLRNRIHHVNIARPNPK